LGKGPDEPWIERVITGTLGDISDTGQESGINVDAWSLDRQVIKASYH